MGNEQTPADKGGDDKEKTITDLRGQIDNLNKGIATYRDEAKTANENATKAVETATQAVTKLAEFEKLFAKKEKGTDLTDEEKKKFKAYAEDNGLVTKADIQGLKNEQFTENLKVVENQAVSEFLESHPEYDADEKWKEVMEQFQLYRQPTTLQGYRALLGRIHKELNPKDSKDGQARARAEIINRQRLGMGGGPTKTGEEGAEAELEKMMKKYPSLSREQIEDRLSEIKNLPTRAKK